MNGCRPQDSRTPLHFIADMVLAIGDQLGCGLLLLHHCADPNLSDDVREIARIRMEEFFFFHAVQNHLSLSP